MCFECSFLSETVICPEGFRFLPIAPWNWSLVGDVVGGQRGIQANGHMWALNQQLQSAELETIY